MYIHVYTRNSGMCGPPDVIIMPTADRCSVLRRQDLIELCLKSQEVRPSPPYLRVNVNVLRGVVVPDHDGTQLTVQLKEHLPLSRQVQVAADRQRLDMQGFAALQLHRELFGDLRARQEVASAQLVHRTELGPEILRKVGENAC